MTHNVSRRTLAKGASWAAPVVVATAAVPAYAASKCASYNKEKLKERVKALFDAYYRRLGRRNMTFNFWYAASSAQNGSSQEAALRVTFQGDANQLMQFPLEFEVALRHVDTSIAVNRTLANKTIQDTSFPATYPGGGLGGAQVAAVRAGTCDTRNGYIRSSFIRVFEDDQRSLLINGAIQQNPDMLCGGDYRYWPARIMPTTSYYANQLSGGGMQDFMNFQFNDASHQGGALYSGIGVRVKGWYPSYDTDIRADKEISDAIANKCITEKDAFEAFLVQQAVDASRAYAGLTVNYYGWGDGSNAVTPMRITPGGWFWSDEAGNFHTGYAGEGVEHTLAHDVRWGRKPGPTTMEDFLRSRVWAVGVKGELEYRDGIF